MFLNIYRIFCEYKTMFRNFTVFHIVNRTNNNKAKNMFLICKKNLVLVFLR